MSPIASLADDRFPTKHTKPTKMETNEGQIPLPPRRVGPASAPAPARPRSLFVFFV